VVNRQELLTDLKRLLRQLEADLRQRCDDLPEVAAALRAEYDAAKEAERTAENFEDWKAGYITQVAAAWVLSCVFIRFLEDNQLVDPPRISGPGERLRRARDEYDLYVRQHPSHTYREYLLNVFDRISELPGGREVLGEHNPVHQQRGWLSGDAARELLDFFQKIEPSTGALVHDFTDPNRDTRFLGDLYQSLSEEARNRYALLQTPEFVEEFILDRTLDPAIETFGLDGFRMIDPACGSGHFLLGSFHRLLHTWTQKEPGTNPRALIQRALDAVHGVDINPYAAAIARFRLLVAALHSCGIARLADAPAFRINVACGDSLLHGTRNEQYVLGFDPLAHAYQSEDLPELRRILKPGVYHAVVANPPYITPKDRALNQAYRVRYSACHGKYSLSVPFMQRIFGLAIEGGYTGQITANSFMKREFGKRLIEQFLPTVDLTHVIDTSGAYIPGHGTPTVILFGRNRRPVGTWVRAVLGINGEPATPSDPARGCVWSAILDQLDHPGSESKFVSVADTEREKFYHHPWSIGGGGAADLKEQLDAVSQDKLGSLTESIGITAFTLADEIFLLPRRSARRNRICGPMLRTMVVGDAIRDWTEAECDVAVFPYTSDFLPIVESLQEPCLRYLWLARTCIANNKMFGGETKVEAGLRWYEFGRLTADKLRTPLAIALAFVATHNHYVIEHGGKVFNRSAPIIKLPPDATEDEHVGLVGLLNSSTACFWLKQVSHNKGSSVDDHGARQTTVAFENFWEFTATKLLEFPLPAGQPTAIATRLIELATQRGAMSPEATLRSASTSQLSDALLMSREKWHSVGRQMVALQEELDWEVYTLYGLTEEQLTCGQTPPEVRPGQRAFEFVMARKMAIGELETTWFERHGSTPTTEIPEEWPEDYRRLIQRRIEVIENSRNIALIEQPEHKRRWNTEPWDEQLGRALKEWLWDRLEGYFDFDGRMNDDGKPMAKIDIACISVARLSDIAGRDGDFMRVGELYRGRPDFDVARLVAELVEEECVPLLPVLRLKPAAMEKRQAWERTWELQRQEDAIDARKKLPSDQPAYIPELAVAQEKRRLVGEIPVPPEYKSSEFQKTTYWRLRGKLDVPKERWVSFPHCEGEDQSLVVAWAGYDHLQLAQAVGTYYAEVKEKGGTKDPRLVPLLAGILELVPWLKQWHNDLDPTYNLRMGDYYAGFVEGEAKELEMTVQQIRDWQPPRGNGGRGRQRKRT